MNPANLYRDALKTPREEANLSWVGFHTFRHTCASLLFEDDPNPVRVQRWLGHHSPSFTLERYVHMLDRHDLREPPQLAAAQQAVSKSVSTRPDPAPAPELKAA